MRGVVAAVEDLADWAVGNPIPLLVIFTVAGMFLIVTSARRDSRSLGRGRADRPLTVAG
jgi:hypothetical protein